MKIRLVIVALAIATGAAKAGAQAPESVDSTSMVVTTDTVAIAHATTPSQIDERVAVRRAAISPAVRITLAETHKGLGQSKALMGVGVVGFFAGAIIGGDSGKLIMVGSAVVGLYGLYQYLQ